MVNSMMLEYFAPIVNTEFTAQMENQLDNVEEGNEDWRVILREFYPPFETMLEVAEKQIEKIEVKDEVSDVPCDKCGAMMVYKMGRVRQVPRLPEFPGMPKHQTDHQVYRAALPQVRRTADGEDIKEEP